MKKVSIVLISISIALVLVGTFGFLTSEGSLRSYLLLLLMAGLLISGQIVSYYEHLKSNKERNQ